MPERIAIGVGKCRPKKATSRCRALTDLALNNAVVVSTAGATSSDRLSKPQSPSPTVQRHIGSAPELVNWESRISGVGEGGGPEA